MNADSQPRPPVKMSDQVFKDASRSAMLLRASRRHPLQLFKTLRELPGLTRLIRSLPTLVVPMSEVDLPVAERLQRGQHLPGMRRHLLCQAVLPLEATQERYLAGKSRGRLRTNLHRADDLGITCAVVDTEDDKRALVEAMSKAQSECHIRDEEMFRYPPDVTWMEARSGDGEQIAMALISQSSRYGLLIRHFASTDHPASSPARFALHSAVVEHVRANGGEYLLVEGKSSLFLEPGIQFFQHLNGYRPMNVLLIDEEKKAFRPFRPKPGKASKPDKESKPGKPSGESHRSAVRAPVPSGQSLMVRNETARNSLRSESSVRREPQRNPSASGG